MFSFLASQYIYLQLLCSYIHSNNSQKRASPLNLKYYTRGKPKEQHQYLKNPNIRK